MIIKWGFLSHIAGKRTPGRLNFWKFSGGTCPRTPLEVRAFGPQFYRVPAYSQASALLLKKLMKTLPVVVSGTVYLFGKVWIESAKAYVRYRVNSICKLFCLNIGKKEECYNLEIMVFDVYFSVVQWQSRTLRDKYSFFQEKRFDTCGCFSTYMYWQLTRASWFSRAVSLDST